MSISNLVDKNVEDDEQPIRESQFGNEEAMLFNSNRGSFRKNPSQKEQPKSNIRIQQPDVIDEKRELEGVEQVESVKLAESRREPVSRLEEPMRYYEQPKLVESEHKKQSMHRQERSGRIKTIESNEEIVVEEAGGRSSGIVVRIKSLREEQVRLPQKVFVELSNETNAAHEQGRQVKRTKLVEKDNLSWDEDFYYNNNVILDDNITFILRGENHVELGRNEVRNLSLLRKKKEAQPDMEKEEFAIQLINEQVHVATLDIEMTFYEREDILGGVLMPNLSLRPPPNFVGQYNAIDGYEPLFTNKLGSKANCFNFFDGEGWSIPELDHIDVFPPKIQKHNRPKKEAA